MKILQIPDSPWSIGQLSEGIRKYNPHIEWKMIYVPPRDIDDHVEQVREAVKWADMVDFQYWNVAWQLVEKIPELKTKPKILTHHNQKNLLSKDWSDFDLLCCKNQYEFDTLNEKYPNKVRMIPNMLEIHDWKYNSEEPKEKAFGYCGRIVPWKGLKEIAKVCTELGYPLYIMGKQDKVNYWNEIPDEYKECMRFDYMDCPDDVRQDFYDNITVYVGNSRDKRESGTLPFLEALACGTPVVTTPSGMAMDIVEDNESALIVDFENYDSLKAQMKKAIEDDELRKKLRKNGWNVIKHYTYEKMAREYEKVYNEVLNQDEPPVSVIIPATYDRVDQVKEIIASLENQTYLNIEAVIVWDCDNHGIEISSDKIVVKEFYTFKEKGYNLAMARNMGVIEAIGEVLVFCDSRLKPEMEAIASFAKAVLETKDKKWFYGDKGSQKKSFVENWSAIRREYFIKGGMCNERIDRYGGMSQELRARFKWQGFELEYLGDAKAIEIKSSKLTNERRKDIIYSKNLLYKMGL